ELWLGGHINPSSALGEFGPRVRRIPFTAWQQLPEVLRDLDVNLAPLAPNSRFNEAKSAIKWLEAALCETPTVASPTQPFREVIDHGVNGLLATTRDEWRTCLITLLDDAPLRRKLGTRARRDALLRWSPHLQGRAYLEILESDLPPRRPSVWTDAVALDEPPMVTTLDAYSLGARRSRPSLDTERFRSVAARGRVAMGRVARSLREDGAAMTVRRALRAARRAGRRLRALARRL
ncbi:MAG: glycosyltransferase, partial [Acidimicrobiia bacterium]